MRVAIVLGVRVFNQHRQRASVVVAGGLFVEGGRTVAEDAFSLWVALVLTLVRVFCIVLDFFRF